MCESVAGEEFVILKFLKNEPNNKNELLSATFLCQFNSFANFRKSNKDIDSPNFFDYSHKFLLQIPVYVTAKLSISNLVVLSRNNKLEEKNYQKLIKFIDPNDMLTRSAPETNHQPIIQCFILTARNWEEYNFLKEIQTKYNCFYDFEFIDHEQYLYILFNINPGQVYDFGNISKRKKQYQYCNLKLSRFSTTNFIKYIFKCNNNESAIEYRNSIQQFLKTGSNPLLIPIEGSALKSWTNITYDIECGRINCYENEKDEPGTFTNPLDSYIQTICCAALKDLIEPKIFRHEMLNNSMFDYYVFVYIGNKSFKNQLFEYKKNKKHAKIFLFDNELEMLCACILFLSMFNQINDMNGLNFDLPFIVNRINLLQNNRESINYVSLGWPFSVQSSIINVILLQCKVCNQSFKLNESHCNRCGKRLDKNNTLLKTIKYKKNLSNYPLSVHIDLQSLEWEPNKDLKSTTGSSSLAALSTFWFKHQICYCAFDRNMLVLYSCVQNLKYYHDLVVGFGQSGHEIIWFNYIKSNTLIKNYSSRLLKTEFFLFSKQINKSTSPNDQNRQEVENLVPLSSFLDNEIAFETEGHIAFYVAINHNQIIPENFIVNEQQPIVINKRITNSNLPENSFISFTKLDINSFKQRNPACCQDYIDLIEYCMIDTLLTAHLSLISKNHIYCMGAKTYRLPVYMAYIAKSGNIANYVDCCSKFNYAIQEQSINDTPQLESVLEKLINKKK